MVKSRRAKKTTTKKPAGMPTLPLPPLPTTRTAPLEPSTAQNVNVQGYNGQHAAYVGYMDRAGGYGVAPQSDPARINGHDGHSHGQHRNGHGHSQGPSHPHSHRAPVHPTQHPQPQLQHLNGNGSTAASTAGEAYEPELLPPPTSIDPLDPRFRAAWQEWTTSALGRLDQLPKLSQNQLAAIARAAAAGVGAGTGGALMANGTGNGGGLGESSEMAALQALQGEMIGNGNGNGNGQQVLGIDLPASLAALFEAKLTLDREKAKLVRMQKELQGYRAAAGRMKE